MNDSRNASYAAFVLRTALGAMFIAHGFYLKLFVFGLAGTVGFFRSLGLPAASAYAVIAAESLGGAMLLLGLYTRPVAVALLPVLLGATWVHAKNGWLFNVQGGGWEYPVFLAIVAVAVAILGQGAFAVSGAAREPARARAGSKQYAV